MRLNVDTCLMNSPSSDDTKDRNVRAGRERGFIVSRKPELAVLSYLEDHGT